MMNTNKTMAPTMIPDNAHKDIPGNPSTAKSSNVKLRTAATADTLRVLTIEQWNFWRENGYIVIKNAVPKAQAQATADFLWEFEEKDPQKYPYKIRLATHFCFSSQILCFCS